MTNTNSSRVKLAIALCALLFLTSCAGAKLPQVAPGKVMGCGAIKRSNSSQGLIFPCLDSKSNVRLAALRGPLILNVWGSWCAACEDELPYLLSFYAKSEGRVQMLGVDVEEAKPADGRAYIIKSGMNWPSVIDLDGRSRGYFGMGVPVTWFINSAGVVKFKKIGAIASEKELRELTLKYLQVEIRK